MMALTRHYRPEIHVAAGGVLEDEHLALMELTFQEMLSGYTQGLNGDTTNQPVMMELLRHPPELSFDKSDDRAAFLNPPLCRKLPTTLTKERFLLKDGSHRAVESPDDPDIHPVFDEPAHLDRLSTSLKDEWASILKRQIRDRQDNWAFIRETAGLSPEAVETNRAKKLV